MKFSNCLIGCGIGCALIVLVFVALIAGGAFFVRNTVDDFSEVIEARQALEDRHGAAEEFTPWPDGAIPADRVEIFLAVRETVAPARARLVELFEALPMTEEQAQELDSKSVLEKIGSAFGLMGSAFGLPGSLGEFLQLRNRALLEHEMGMGEYTYIYVLTYYTWLGHSPNESPENRRIRIDVEDRRGAMGTKIGNPTYRSRIHGELVRMLRNQLAAVEADGRGGEAWREALADEIETLEADRGRVPWQDGLPAAMVTALEPYRERLGSAYDPSTNQFELSRTRKAGRFSIQAE